MGSRTPDPSRPDQPTYAGSRTARPPRGATSRRMALNALRPLGKRVIARRRRWMSSGSVEISTWTPSQAQLGECGRHSSRYHQRTPGIEPHRVLQDGEHRPIRVEGREASVDMAVERGRLAHEPEVPVADPSDPVLDAGGVEQRELGESEPRLNGLGLGEIRYDEPARPRTRIERPRGQDTLVLAAHPQPFVPGGGARIR